MVWEMRAGVPLCAKHPFLLFARFVGCYAIGSAATFCGCSSCSSLRSGWRSSHWCSKWCNHEYHVPRPFCSLHCTGATRRVALPTIAQTQYRSQLSSSQVCTFRGSPPFLLTYINSCIMYSCTSSRELRALPNLPKGQLEERLHSRERIEAT